MSADSSPRADVGLLTGGSDKPYALGLAAALSSQNLRVDFIGSNELDCPEVHGIAGLRFLNLRGDQREDAGFARKALRLATYYAKLLAFASRRTPKLLHILWNNRFEGFDRTLLMLYYRLAGKRTVLTAHNVNAAKRDKRDSWWNRATLRTQYRLCDHLFVHTDAMRNELVEDFGVARSKVSVIPFGINDTIPTSAMTPDEARRQFDLRPDEKTLLFFGQIAPYKGLEYLIRALRILADGELCVRLIVAGKVKHGHLDYWTSIERAIDEERVGPLVTRRIGFIPDEGVEPYFKAADAVAIPYVDIFQSGVPFLAFSFGVPVIATDVGSLREDVVAETGILCRPRDAADLADGIRRFFTSDLYSERERRRTQIREYGRRHHSWEVVAAETKRVYGALLAGS